jgi:hypothetical protein
MAFVAARPIRQSVTRLLDLVAAAFIIFCKAWILGDFDCIECSHDSPGPIEVFYNAAASGTEDSEGNRFDGWLSALC